MKFIVHNRYLLIEYETYPWHHPMGGIKDVKSSTQSREDAMQWFEEKVKEDSCGFQVFDCIEQRLIAQWESER